MIWRTDMKFQTAKSNLSSYAWIACGVALACLLLTGILSAQQSQSNPASTPATPPKTFATPEAAADALIDAAEKYDVAAIEGIFGTGGEDIIHTGEPARDREIAKLFAEQARTKMDVSVDPLSKRRAFVSVGN